MFPSSLSSRAAVALSCGAILCTSVLPARADDAPPPADPGVARLSLLRNEVDLTRADSGDVFAAAVNTPLAIGDGITTLDASYAEVQLDHGAAMRVAPATQLRFTTLDPADHVAQLAAGAVEIRTFRSVAAHPEIDTPGAAIRPDTRGTIRISVDGDGNTQVTVLSGRADVTAGANTQTLAAGTALDITGTGDDVQTQSADPAPPDAFDRFNSERDAYLERFHDQQYVDAGLVGADDLDGYGHWISNVEYGSVWVPDDQSDGWAPYHSGRWVWEDYYGWTWVAAEPWGWAPYHYGNWFYAAGTGWCWYPGASAPSQPYVYRPALVAFFSFGNGGGGIGATFGNVGWVPIAPGEPFHPWWGIGGGWGYGGGSTTVINTTTIVNNTTVIDTYRYRNAGAPGGAVAVTNGAFARGNFRNVVPVTPEQFAAVQPIRGVVPIVPTTRNLAFDGSNVAPLSSERPGAAFAGFKAPAVAPHRFSDVRAAVAGAATVVYPEHAQTFERQLHPPAAATTPLEHPGVTSPGTVAPAGAKPGEAPAEPKPEATTRPDPFARFNSPPDRSGLAPSGDVHPGEAPAVPAAHPATAAPHVPAAKSKKRKPKPAPSA